MVRVRVRVRVMMMMMLMMMLLLLLLLLLMQLLVHLIHLRHFVVQLLLGAHHSATHSESLIARKIIAHPCVHHHLLINLIQCHLIELLLMNLWCRDF